MAFFRFPSPRVRSCVGLVLASALVAAACADARNPTPDPRDSNGGGQVPDGSVTADDRPNVPPPAIDGAPSGADCLAYCTKVTDSCTGAYAQYTSVEQCLAVCDTLPRGTTGERSGNSVACRTSYAGNVARTDPAGYCAVAGPFGGGVCGERCDAFCAIALGVCTRTAWETVPSCVSACTNLKYVEQGAEAGEGLAGPMTGDTLNCRSRRLLEALSVPEQCDELGPGGACAATPKRN